MKFLEKLDLFLRKEINVINNLCLINSSKFKKYEQSKIKLLKYTLDSWNQTSNQLLTLKNEIQGLKNHSWNYEDDYDYIQIKDKLNHLISDFIMYLLDFGIFYHNKKGELYLTPDKIFIEIRAGCGGLESSLFARDLLLLYQNYVSIFYGSYEQLCISINETVCGGIRDAILQITRIDKEANYKCVLTPEGLLSNSISPKTLFDLFYFESGVHRLQRVSTTDNKGRVHTCTAAVIVTPLYKSSTRIISNNDIKFEFFRSSGPGGQSVNKIESAVRAIHIPTNKVITIQDTSSQLENKNKAVKLLKAKILVESLDDISKRINRYRNIQISSNNRNERIRTYCLVNNTFIDHRVQSKKFHISKIDDADKYINELVNILWEDKIIERIKTLLENTVKADNNMNK